MDYERRFGGVARLYGKDGAERIRTTPFVVIGVGGVGSWVAEALIRTAAESLTLIDLDNVAESNTNRQIQALDGNFGKAKITAIAERAALINPKLTIGQTEDFVTEENIAEILTNPGAIVLDCIDQARAKAAILAYCKKHKMTVVTCGAAGGRVDPSRLRVGDLAQISGDPLIASVRYRLRKTYGFPKNDPGREVQKSWGIRAVYSDEPIRRPAGESCDIDTVQQSHGLACSGYGSSVTVTATQGFIMASLAIEAAISRKKA